MKYILFVSGLLMISLISQSQWSGTGSIYYNGGHVGIGTTSPGYKLTVAAGDIKSYNYDKMILNRQALLEEQQRKIEILEKRK